jgi:predicted SAM-dependent methyltransferase
MKINLGCGDRYATGWWNVDHAGSPHPRDDTIDLTAGPLPSSWLAITHVYAGHVLEHLRVGECLTLLRRLRRRMLATSELMIVGPDVPAAEAMAQAGTLDVTLDSLRYGAHRWPGDEHRWECSADDVMAMLSATDWSRYTALPMAEVPKMWPVADRGPAWQFAILARP